MVTGSGDRPQGDTKLQRPDKTRQATLGVTLGDARWRLLILGDKELEQQRQAGRQHEVKILQRCHHIWAYSNDFGSNVFKLAQGMHSGFFGPTTFIESTKFEFGFCCHGGLLYMMILRQLFEIFTQPNASALQCHNICSKLLHDQCNSGQLLAHSKHTQSILWTHSEHTRRSIKDHWEFTQRSFREHKEITQVSIRNHSEIILRSLRYHPEIT